MAEYDNTNRGALFKNDKCQGNQPTHTGKLNVNGVDYELSAWVKESKSGRKFFSLSIRQPRNSSGQQSAVTQREQSDDDLPF